MTQSSISEQLFMYQLDQIDVAFRRTLEESPLVPIQHWVEGSVRISIALLYDDTQITKEFTDRALQEYKEKRRPYIEFEHSKSEEISDCSVYIVAFWAQKTQAKL